MDYYFYLVVKGKQERMELSNYFLFLQKFPTVYICPSVAHIDSRETDARYPSVHPLTIPPIL